MKDRERKRGKPVRKLKQRAALTLTTAAMLAGSVAVSSPANAASPWVAACGSGYYEIDHHDLAGVVTFHLMYNGSTDCEVAWKTAYVGTPTHVGTVLTRQSDGYEVADSGSYSYYAGPVKLPAPGTCIAWGGNAGSYGYWASRWSHCG
jgi:hypothetical protein